MSSQSFAPYLQTTFIANSADLKPTWLTLVAITSFEGRTPATGRGAAPQTDAFALQFYAVGEPLSQGTYDLQHPSLGQLKLLLVPGFGNQNYTAVINHLLEPIQHPIPQRSPRLAARATAENRLRRRTGTRAVQTDAARG